jgi:hypothetical protein
MSNDVNWVNNTLDKGKLDNFIRAYLKKYERINTSKLPAPPKRNYPGMYFINFIETCKQVLLSNPRYYHYNNGR